MPVPSRSAIAGVTAADSFAIGGGESGYIAVRSDDPNVVFAGNYQGILTRYDRRTGQARNIMVWPESSSGEGAGSVKYRMQWTAPTVHSPHDPNILYHTGNHVFRTNDEGTTWEKISPDLTRNDRSKLGPSGGPITKDNTGAEYYCTIFALAESPVERGVLWAGSDDGLLHVSRDDGKTWKNVTPAAIRPYTLVSIIEPSPHDGATAYVAVTRYKHDDFRPYLFKTTNYGRTWTKITNGIPADDEARQELPHDGRDDRHLPAGREARRREGAGEHRRRPEPAGRRPRVLLAAGEARGRGHAHLPRRQGQDDPLLQERATRAEGDAGRQAPHARATAQRGAEEGARAEGTQGGRAQPLRLEHALPGRDAGRGRPDVGVRRGDARRSDRNDGPLPRAPRRRRRAARGGAREPQGPARLGDAGRLRRAVRAPPADPRQALGGARRDQRDPRAQDADRRLGEARDGRGRRVADRPRRGVAQGEGVGGGGRAHPGESEEPPGHPQLPGEAEPQDRWPRDGRRERRLRADEGDARRIRGSLPARRRGARAVERDREGRRARVRQAGPRLGRPGGQRDAREAAAATRGAAAGGGAPRLTHQPRAR